MGTLHGENVNPTGIGIKCDISSADASQFGKNEMTK